MRTTAHQSTNPARDPLAAQVFRDCLQVAWSEARRGGLAEEDAAQLCTVVLLQLSEQRGMTQGRDLLAWARACARVETTRTRRLHAWRGENDRSSLREVWR